MTVVPDDGDPIPAEQAAIVALVIDQIEPDTDITAEDVHRGLVAESSNPPSLRDVRAVLDILAMPHVGFTPGESSALRWHFRPLSQRFWSSPAGPIPRRPSRGGGRGRRPSTSSPSRT